MKKKRLPCLSVSRETIRRLDDPMMRLVAGGTTGAKCPNTTSPIKTAEPTCGATHTVK